MTVEQAIHDWFAEKMGGDSKGTAANGATPIVGAGGNPESPYFEGWRIVNRAIRRVGSPPLGEHWIFTIKSGGTRTNLFNDAEKHRYLVECEIRKILAEQPKLKEFEIA